MTPMERLYAAATGAPSDRIPVFCHLIDQGAAELGMSLQEYYSNGEHVAEGQLIMQRKYGYDNLWSLFYVAREAEMLGCKKILYASDGPPNVDDFVIKTYDDIHRLTIPENLQSNPALAENLKCLRLLKDETKGSIPLFAYITSSMTMPALLMGMDKWMELLFLGPREVRDELLAKCSDFFVKEFNALKDAGADIFCYSAPFCSTDFLPMRVIEELSIPWMQRDLQDVGTAGVVFFGASARINQVIGRVMEKTGITTYYPSPLEDVAESREIIAGRALYAGVINDIQLIRWSREEIRKEVKRIIDAGMPGGRFFFGTLLMPAPIPPDNIRAMLEAAYEFGSYKHTG
ncbi:MAG: uroporphyrinogen decarboxylase family protein [Nitrospirae bacterium]|nr:uroporphyrinogen decarboxylase family protein [Nitrospirota bacterium]